MLFNKQQLMVSNPNATHVSIQMYDINEHFVFILSSTKLFVEDPKKENQLHFNNSGQQRGEIALESSTSAVTY